MPSSNPSSSARLLRSLGVGASVLVGGAVALGACSDAPERTVGTYCDKVREHLEVLMNPGIVTPADIVATLDRYRSIADVAPAGVEPEWQRVILVLETAATVIPGDQASLEIANRTALAGTPAYEDLKLYTQQECGVVIGTPTTPTNPVTATTVVPPTTIGG